MNTQPIMSVSGIRGVVGESFTARLCAEVAYVQTTIAGAGAMIVARDTRPSGRELARAAAAGIHAAGGQAIDIGIAPTPTACVAVDHLKASGGIILTASHNPAPYNGYKMIHRSGRLCTGAECEAVYAAFRQGAGARAGDAMDKDVTAPAPATPFTGAAEVHISRILATVDCAAIRKADLTICFDAVNGAASVIVPELLRRLGVKYHAINADRTGNFTHNPEPRPEHLCDLARLLASTPNCQAGFAFDPDADRLATMGERGEPISEEYTLAFALQNVLAKEKSDVATNLSTSMVIDDVASAFGVAVHRSKIGEANVVEAMAQHACRIGGEGNGGVIYPRISTVRDGPAALALILELIAVTGRSITQLAASLPSYYMVKEKIPLSSKNPQRILDALAARFCADRIDRQDGLKIIHSGAWVHLRPSNTEPILRCYAEARTEDEARSLVANVLKECGSL